MRPRLGRPDIARYRDRFDVPPAVDGGLSVTFLGVATLLVDDGSSRLLTDGFFSRPSLATCLLRKVSPDHERIVACLDRAGIKAVDAVLPVHTHYDHVMDSAYVAERTGAVLVGGESAANVGRGHGLPAERVEIAVPGKPASYGAFDVTHIESHHCPPDRYPGTIDQPDLGVGQLGHQDDDYIRTYWDETVATVGARRVVLIHWDDFFRPLDLPLRALPYFGDDLDHSMWVLTRLAERDGVTLHFPAVWQRENPWSGLG